MTMRYTLSPTDYTIAGQIVGVGFLQSLLEIEGSFRSLGTIEDNKILPRKFTTDVSWRGEKNRATVFFHPAKNPTYRYTPEERAFAPGQFPEDILIDSLDPASVSLMIARKMQQSGSCALVAKIFTGRHRIDFEATDQGPRALPENDILLNAPPTHLCHATLTKQRPNDKPKDSKPILLKLYLAPATANTPPYPVLLDVTINRINCKVWMIEQAQS